MFGDVTGDRTAFADVLSLEWAELFNDASADERLTLFSDIVAKSLLRRYLDLVRLSVN
jgi:hypothetical protein